MREGVAVPGNPADSFPVDGQAYIFSTLRPDAGAAGSLRLTTLHRNWLKVLLFAGVLGFGLLLLSGLLAERVASLARRPSRFCYWASSGRSAAHVLFGGFWLAILLTLLVWVGVALLKGSSRFGGPPPAPPRRSLTLHRVPLIQATPPPATDSS